MTINLSLSSVLYNQIFSDYTSVIMTFSPVTAVVIKKTRRSIG